jgi:phosphotransferase system  glucose/maltose/N-acetylglucosamine-specific IIC component
MHFMLYSRKIIIMLDILPGYYVVFLALGLAAIVVVLFYSFTRNSNYEVQQRAKKIQQKREKENQARSNDA